MQVLRIRTADGEWMVPDSLTGIQAELTAALGLEDQGLVRFSLARPGYAEVANATLRRCHWTIPPKSLAVDAISQPQVDLIIILTIEERSLHERIPNPHSTLPQEETARWGEFIQSSCLLPRSSWTGYELSGGSTGINQRPSNACSRLWFYLKLKSQWPV